MLIFTAKLFARVFAIAVTVLSFGGVLYLLLTADLSFMAIQTPNLPVRSLSIVGVALVWLLLLLIVEGILSLLFGMASNDVWTDIMKDRDRKATNAANAIANFEGLARSLVELTIIGGVTWISISSVVSLPDDILRWVPLVAGIVICVGAAAIQIVFKTDWLTTLRDFVRRYRDAARKKGIAVASAQAASRREPESTSLVLDGLSTDRNIDTPLQFHEVSENSTEHQQEEYVAGANV